MLIEFTRLDTVNLKKFMTKHPTEALKKLPAKEVRKIVRADKMCWGVESSPNRTNLESSFSSTQEIFLITAVVYAAFSIAPAL